MPENLPFKISVLIFLRDKAGKFLMIKRKKSPNKDCWSPVGGKLEMQIGESPFECAVREAREETGIKLCAADLHLFGMVSEKSYEGSGHWLMFLFNCKKPLDELPPEIDEGNFAFFARDEIDNIAIPPTDKILVWPVFDEHAEAGTFLAYRAKCGAGTAERVLEERIPRI
ncbi:MAG: NUDIX domain-containing protein [Opitutae bacterium]|nr:NUDIX domain-containing protein [Opitutae bacterium]